MRKAIRRFALWRADLDGGVCAAPEECVDSLRLREHTPLVLEHREHGVTPTNRVFEATLRDDGEWQFAGVDWPADLRPGVLVTVTWQATRDEVVARTVPLAEPLRVDGTDYFHEYDPRVVTREFSADDSNRGRVLGAVRREGRVFDDGSAVLEEAGLAARCGLGRGARGAFLLRNAVDQLIREGYLTRVPGSLDPVAYPAYPAVDGQRPAEMLFYAPLVEPAPFPGEDDDAGGEGAAGHDHWVTGFVRKLPPGAQPSERQLTLHEQAVETDQVDEAPLAPGYTYVQKHRRHA
jgi:ketosteroid isomerase-like protein